jgi:autotransporter-associated beta strand protein
MLFAASAQATTLYWDTNGSTAGSASVGDTAPGTWGVNDYWNTSSNGTGTAFTSTTTSADDLVFSAGTDASGTYTVNLSGTQSARKIQVSNGNVTLNGAIDLSPGTGSNLITSPGRALTVTGAMNISGNLGFDVQLGSPMKLLGGIEGPGYTVSNTGNSNSNGWLYVGTSNYDSLADVALGGIVATGNHALGNSLANINFATKSTLGFEGGVNYTDLKPVTISGVGVGGLGAIRGFSGNNSFAGDITLTANTYFAVDAGSLTLSGNLSSAVAASISKYGPGTLIVSGNDTRAAGSTVTVNEGTLVYSGTNTYTGTTTVGGSVQISRAGLTLDFSQANSPTDNILNHTTNSSALSLNGADVQIVGGSTVANSQRFNGLSLNAGGANSFAATSNGQNLLVSLGTLSRAANNAATIDFTLPSGTQSATNGIVINPTALPGGIIPYATIGQADWATRDAGTGNILPYAAYVANNFAGGTADNVDVSAGSFSPGAFTVNSLRFSGATTLTLDGSTKSQLGSGAMLVTPTGNVTIGGSGSAAISSSVTNGEFIVHNYGTLNVNVPLAPGGAGTTSVVAFAGSGVTNLNAANTFTGALNVTAGTVNLTGSGSLATASVNVANGATFGATGTLQPTTTLTNSGIVEFGSGAKTIGRLVGAGTLGDVRLNNTTLTIDNGIGNAAYKGNISGTGSLIKTGAFMQGFGPETSNTFTGGILIQEGILQVTSPSGDVSNPATPFISVSPGGFIVEAGAELQYTAGGNRFWIDDATLRGGTLSDTLSTNNHHVGDIILEENSFIAKGAATFTIDGNITGDSGFEYIGPASMTLNGTGNTYEGPTTISAGFVTVNAISSLGSTSALTVQNSNTGTGSNVALTLNNLNQTVGSLSGSIATPSSGTNTATITIGGSNNTLTVVQTANGTYEGLLAGNSTAKLLLHEDSTARLTLTAANTYGGGTTINGGTLLVNNSTGSGTGAGNVFVNDGGTLGGTGTIAGSVLATSGGTIAPGIGIGELTINGVGGVTFQTNSIFTAQVGGVAAGLHDHLAVQYDATLAGLLDVKFVGGFLPDAGDEIVLLSADSLTGVFANASDEAIRLQSANVFFHVRYDNNQVTLFDFAIAPAPEPSSLLLCGLGLLALAGKRRKARGDRNAAEKC